MAEPRIYRYPIRQFLTEAGGAVTGVTFFGAPLLFVKPSSVIFLALTLVIALFVVYGIRAMIRQKQAFRLTDAGLVRTGLNPCEISWNTLKRVRVRYYSTRRDRTSGWLQMIVDGEGKTVRVDSALIDFDVFTSEVVGKAAEIGAELDGTTIQNCLAAGISLPRTLGG